METYTAPRAAWRSPHVYYGWVESPVPWRHRWSLGGAKEVEGTCINSQSSALCVLLPIKQQNTRASISQLNERRELQL